MNIRKKDTVFKELLLKFNRKTSSWLNDLARKKNVPVSEIVVDIIEHRFEMLDLPCEGCRQIFPTDQLEDYGDSYRGTYTRFLCEECAGKEYDDEHS